MKQSKILFIPIITITFFCTIGLLNGYAQPKEFFVPKALIIPGHHDHKQFFYSFGYDGGFDLNLSRTLPHNFSIFATGNINVLPYYRNEGYRIFKNDYSWSVGAGHFKYDRHNFINVVELLVGVGSTGIDNYIVYKNTSEDQDWITKANYLTAFAQINGLAKRKKVEFGFASRMSYNQYNSLNFYRRGSGFTTQSSNKFKYINFEPAFSFSYLVANFRGNIQAGISIPLFSQDTELIDSSNSTSIEDYSDIYFFWRLSIQLLKKQEVKRR